MKRRDVLKLGAAALTTPAAQLGCATPRGAAAPDNAETRAYNAVLLASPGDLDRAVPPVAVEGKIPDELRGGRFYVNGPGKLKYDDEIIHPFDGHGYVRKFTFTEAGGVDLKARFVRTSAFVDEQKAGRLLYPGIGTLADGEGIRNVANTTVVPYRGELLAGWEGGAPHALSKASLKTMRTERFDGLVDDDEAFLAHMRLDAYTGRLVGCMPELGMTTKLRFVELDAEGELVGEKRHEVKGTMLLHDFVVTPRYYVLAQNPLRVDLLTLLGVQAGTRTMLDMIDGDGDAPGKLLLIPRVGRPGKAREIELGSPTFVIHYGNAWDDGDDVVVELSAFPNLHFGQELGYDGRDRPLNPRLSALDEAPRLLRARVKPGDGVELSQIATYALDFPRVRWDQEGRAAPALYAATRAARDQVFPFDALIRVDLDDLERPERVWTPGRGRLVGEPVFAPKRGGERVDEGWVVQLVYDGALRETQLVILDAADVARGPVASARFPLLPYGFHGWYESAA